MPTLMISDNGAVREATPDEVLQTAGALINATEPDGRPKLTSPSQAIVALHSLLRNRDRESFYLIHMNVQQQIIKIEEVSQGTLASASVYPREILKSAIRHNTAVMVLVHNHPSSGDARPSPQDEVLTKRLKELLSFIDVTVIDHIVLGHRDYFSFAEHGLL